MLHLIAGKQTGTYSQLCQTVLLNAVRLSKTRVDIVFDNYKEHSLNDERCRRNANNERYVITGPEQRCPWQLSEALKSNAFKQMLPSFFAEEWKKAEYSGIIGKRHVYLAHQEKCYCFTSVNGQVRRVEIPDLSCNHLEADTRICLHASKIETGNVVIRTSDTDIAVIAISYASQLNVKLWMETGTASNNNQRYICLTNIAAALGINMCKALPAFHAFSGCDYTSAFVRRGKVRPLMKLEKNECAQIAFAKLADDSAISDDTINEIEKFTASIYGAKEDCQSLNGHRFQVVYKSFGPKKDANPFDKIKGVDGSCLPPCEAELLPHIQRAAFVARMWANAHEPYINQSPCQSDGWDFHQWRV